MSKEAMRLALEALIAATPVKAKDPQMQADAIVALREALAEQPAQQEQDRQIDQLIQERDHRDEIIDKLCDTVLGPDRYEWSSQYFFEDAVRDVEERMAALDQPAQQEPVAFLDWYDNAHWGNEDFKDGCWRAWDAALAQRQARSADTWVHATAWRGLTDDEIEQGCKESWVTEQAFQSAVWWAEAKLKEKNT